MDWGVPGWDGAIAAVPPRVPLVLVQHTRDYWDSVFLGNLLFPVEIRAELQQVLFPDFTLVDLGDPTSPGIPSAVCQSLGLEGRGSPRKQPQQFGVQGLKNDTVLTKTPAFISNPVPARFSPSLGPGEAEPRPCPSAGRAGPWGGGRSCPGAASISPPRRPRGSARVSDRPQGPIPHTEAVESSSRGLLGPAPGQTRGSARGHGDRRRQRGAASPRGPEPRGARGVPGAPRGRVCFGTGAKAARRGRGSCCPSRASSRRPVKAPAGSASAPPRTPRSIRHDAAARAPRRPRPVR